MREYYFKENIKKKNHLENAVTFVKRISVEKLHGNKNLDIEIYDNCLVIVGDNGFGKTSLLNMIYAIFSGNVKYLQDINFRAVSIDFIRKGSEELENIRIEKEELDIVNYFDSEVAYRNKKNTHGVNSRVLRSKRDIQLSMWDEYEKNIEFVSDRKNRLISDRNILELYKKTTMKIEDAREKLGFETLFLPTYRRIEQRSEYFGLDEVEDININFGMNDVKNAIKDITNKIIQSSIDWISKVNGQMINEILDIENNIMYFNEYDQKTIEKTLARIDKKYLSNNSRRRIFKLIESGDIYNNSTLVYFLNNMLKLHEDQNKNDNKLIRFSEICNKYLKNKKIKYDEIKVSLKVIKFSKDNKEEDIDFNLLSSGEKQIISIFARLILTEDKNIAVIFDEPEISISITWQKMILEDIYNLDNCGFLIASTHSPFVFSNKLKRYTVDIEEKLGY